MRLSLLHCGSIRRGGLAAVAACGLLLAVASTWAFINPDFSPIHLVQQSDQVLLLKFEGPPKDGKATATVVEAVKGEKPKGPVKFDFLAGAFEAQGKEIAGSIDKGTEALLFVGFFEDEGGGGGMPQDQEAKGFLHLHDKWVTLSSWKGQWDMDKIEARMLGTWAGSTDMLLRAIRYVMADEDADVPVKVNAEWSGTSKVGSVAGKVSGARAVYLDDGAPYLFVASAGGDKLYRCDKGKMTDVTAAHKIASKSAASTWVDLNGDGKIDLLSSDGKTLTRCLQGADGTFAADQLPAGKDLGQVTSLTVLCASKSGVAVVAGTAQGASLLTIASEKVTASPLEGAGAGGKVLVADFDGDALPDVLLLMPESGLLYKGTKPGEIAAKPQPVKIGMGRGVTGVAMGDWDQDGLPDVFCTAEDRNRFWQNRGKGQFEELLGESGEVAYISKAGGVDACTGDVNNDGRQDLLIAYAAQPPQVFFNRGFRCFGHARELDVGEMKGPATGDGQQACCLADFNGDGAQDMVLVLKNGEVWMFPRRTADVGALAATVLIPPDSGGPVSIRAKAASRNLGAWFVNAAGPAAFFGAEGPGPVTVTYTFPGGKPQTKEVLLVDAPVRQVVKP